MKNHFILELANLRRQLCSQGAAVELSIDQAIKAFQNRDAELARRIIAHDAVIDREEIRLEEECLKVLALYQPVAGDLRTIVSCIKINASLERMADFACHIAERALHLSALQEIPRNESFDFMPMEHLVLKMLHDTLHVVESSDVLLAHKVIESDDAVDSMRREHRAHARTACVLCPEAAEYYIDCIGLARDLERIADLATDICQQIIYLCTGCITRHSG